MHRSAIAIAFAEIVVSQTFGIISFEKEAESHGLSILEVKKAFDLQAIKKDFPYAIKVCCEQSEIIEDLMRRPEVKGLRCRSISIVATILETLKTNVTLTMLDLYFNRIGDKEARMIAEALKINSTLHRRIP